MTSTTGFAIALGSLLALACETKFDDVSANSAGDSPLDGAPAESIERANPPNPSEAEPAVDASATEPAGDDAVAHVRDAADPVAQSTAERSEPGLELQLVVPRADVLLGEPFTLGIVLLNRSESEREASACLAPEYGFLQVLVTSPSGEERPYIPVATKRCGRGKLNRMLRPGERISDLISLYLSNSESGPAWFLTETGSYSAIARFGFNKDVYESERIVFRITDAQGEGSRRAAERFMKTPSAFFFYAQGGKDPARRVEELEQLAREYPESHVAGYAHLALGQFFNREGYDPEIGKREPDYTRALESLERATELLSDPVFWTTGAIELERCYTKLGLSEKAVAIRATASRRHPVVIENALFEGLAPRAN